MGKRRRLRSLCTYSKQIRVLFMNWHSPVDFKLAWKLSLASSTGPVYTGLFSVRNPLLTPCRCCSRRSWAFWLLSAVHPGPNSPLRPRRRVKNTLRRSSSRTISSKWSREKRRWPPGRASEERRPTPKISSLCRFTARPDRPAIRNSSTAHRTSGGAAVSTFKFREQVKRLPLKLCGSLTCQECRELTPRRRAEAGLVSLRAVARLSRAEGYSPTEGCETE